MIAGAIRNEVCALDKKFRHSRAYKQYWTAHVYSYPMMGSPRTAKRANSAAFPVVITRTLTLTLTLALTLTLTLTLTMALTLTLTLILALALTGCVRR